jgi:hypothetical protein
VGLAGAGAADQDDIALLGNEAAAARSLTSVWLIGLPPLIGKIIEKSNGRQLDTQQLRPEQARH